MSDINTYIQQSRQSGMSDEQIKNALIEKGWLEEQINPVLSNSVQPAPIDPSPITQKLVLGGLNISKRNLIIAFAAVLILGSCASAYFYFTNKDVVAPNILAPGSNLKGVSDVDILTTKVTAENFDEWRSAMEKYYANTPSSGDIGAYLDQIEKNIKSDPNQGKDISAADWEKLVTQGATNNFPSGSSQPVSAGQTQDGCGFNISPPKEWIPVGVWGIFHNVKLDSAILSSCKPDAFENNYYVLMLPAQALMTKPDSGFYVTSAENTTVGGKKAYLFREQHKFRGKEIYELVLMVDSGIKNASKNQMDIIYARIDGEYKVQYEAILKEALYSYKR